MDIQASIKLGSVAETVSRASRSAARSEGIDFAAECGGILSGDTFARCALEAAIEAKADLETAIGILEAQLAKGTDNDQG